MFKQITTKFWLPKNASNWLEYSANNNTLKSIPHNGKDSYKWDWSKYTGYFSCKIFLKRNPSENRPPRNLSHNKDFAQDMVQSILYKEECPTVTNLPNGIEIHKY